MGAQAFIHRRVGVEKLVKNNEIAGFKFATVGVIYAVLLAFTVIVVWEKFSAAENAVDQEAASIAALLRYAGGKEPAAVALRQSVAAYAQTAIQDEWPAMENESESPATTRALDAVYGAALAARCAFIPTRSPMCWRNSRRLKLEKIRSRRGSAEGWKRRRVRHLPSRDDKKKRWPRGRIYVNGAPLADYR